MDKAIVRVAIVDDEESVRRALLRLFRLERFQAQAFSSAGELLESFADARPDCIILDLHMPDMTGLELLKQFSTLDERPPVIVVTADDDRDMLRQCQILGVTHYLRKPIDREVLLSSVRDVT